MSVSSYTAAFENAPEQRTPVDLDIHGIIPPWLSGVLYRTGPGTYQIPSTAAPSKVIDIQHWFDGLSMHHRFEIFPGGKRVSYRSRSGAEDLEKRIADAGNYPTISFGQQDDPCQSIFRKFFTVFQTAMNTKASSSPSSANVSVTLTPNMPGWDTKALDLPTTTGSGPRYIVAKTDVDSLQLLHPDTLEPLVGADYKSIDPRLDGTLSAAHSCRDKETGDFYNFNCKIGGRHPTYKVFRIAGKDGEVDVLAEIEDAPLAYIHSFAMTEGYVILCIWQAHIKLFGASILYNKNLAQAIEKKWNPNEPTLFYVVDRVKGGVVAKYKTPPFFCFHQLNAFDDPSTGDIVMDMSVYDDNSVLDLLYLDNLRDPNTGNMVGKARRFRLRSPHSSESSSTFQDAAVECTFPLSHSIELPVVAPSVYHKPYRYAYGINKLDPKEYHTFADGIIKLDMASPSPSPSSPHTKVWRKPGHTPSEPIFVPRPDGKDEDDGVLLSVVLDEQAMRSSMVVIDAKEMTEIARAEMGGVFPIGFHGVFCATQA